MASTYLSRTPSSAGNRKTWTWSCWFKRGNLSGAWTALMEAGSGSAYNTIGIDGSERLILCSQDEGSGGVINLWSSQLVRDTSAWYHFVVAYDSTQATASNRVKGYINGEQITSFNTSVYPALNYDTYINSTNPHNIGKRIGSTYFDGSMAHVHFIDGTAYDADTFGETDATTGIWKPKTAPSVTYGTNGFFLKFENSGAFGTDSSGNANTFTVNGTMTQNIDTPSNVFATLNPLVRNKSYNEGTLTNGNLGFAPNGRAITCSTLGVTSGKYYAEFKATAAGGIYLGAGLMKGITSQGQTNPIWYDNAEGFAIAIANNGNLESGTNQGSTSYGASFTDNDIIGIALDMDNKEMYIHKNGTYMNSGDPTSGASKTGGVTGATSYNPFDDGEEVFFMVADVSAGGVGECQCNFGNGYFGTTVISSAQNPDDGIGIFEYDVPAGYKALCTKSINAQEYD